MNFRSLFLLFLSVFAVSRCQGKIVSAVLYQLNDGGRVLYCGDDHDTQSWVIDAKQIKDIVTYVKAVNGLVINENSYDYQGDDAKVREYTAKRQAYNGTIILTKLTQELGIPIFNAEFRHSKAALENRSDIPEYSSSVEMFKDAWANEQESIIAEIKNYNFGGANQLRDEVLNHVVPMHSAIKQLLFSCKWGSTKMGSYLEFISSEGWNIIKNTTNSYLKNYSVERLLREYDCKLLDIRMSNIVYQNQIINKKYKTIIICAGNRHLHEQTEDKLVPNIDKILRGLGYKPVVASYIEEAAPCVPQDIKRINAEQAFYIDLAQFFNDSNNLALSQKFSPIQDDTTQEDSDSDSSGRTQIDNSPELPDASASEDFNFES